MRPLPIITFILLFGFFGLKAQNTSDLSYSYEENGNKEKAHFSQLHTKSSKTGNWILGLRFVQQFNMPILHSVLALNIQKGKSNFYLGPHYTHISKRRIKSENEIDFNQSSVGLNGGYAFTVYQRRKTFSVFLQLDFSLYQAENWYYTEYYSDIESEKTIVLENCLSVGLKYYASKRLSLITGYGFGSTAGFFLLFDQAIPHVYFGLQYNFR